MPIIRNLLTGQDEEFDSKAHNFVVDRYMNVVGVVKKMKLLKFPKIGPN
jgi:hypothetical protein